MTFYDNPSRHIYTYDQVNLGTAFSRTIQGPFNKRGRVLSVAGQVTAAITGASPTITVTGTMPNVQTSPSTPNTNPTPLELSYQPPLMAAGTGFSSDFVPSAVQRDANNFLPILAANAPITLAVAPGASGAGTADLELVIDWF